MAKNTRMCGNCGIRRSATGHKRTLQDGSEVIYYKRKCRTCFKHPNLGLKAKQTHCTVCLIDFNPVQLDVDHLDGDNTNNNPNNLQIICACCHRLKSLMCQNWSTFKD